MKTPPQGAGWINQLIVAKQGYIYAAAPASVLPYLRDFLTTTTSGAICFSTSGHG